MRPSGSWRAALAFHESSSAPEPATTRSTSQSARPHRSNQASNRVSKPFLRSPSAPTNSARRRADGRPSERRDASRSAGSTRPKPGGIDPVVHDPRPISRDVRQLHHVIGGAAAVADHQARAFERAALFGHVPLVLPPGAQAIGETGGWRVECGMHVVHPVEIAEIGVAAVGERAKMLGRQTAPDSRRRRSQQRLAEAVDAERARNVVYVHALECGELRRDLMADKMNGRVLSAGEVAARARNSPCPSRHRE